MTDPNPNNKPTGGEGLRKVVDTAKNINPSSPKAIDNKERMVSQDGKVYRYTDQSLTNLSD